MNGADLITICLLLVATTVVWLNFKRRTYAATNVFSIVMSLGIFTGFALTKLPYYSPNIGKIITFEIIIIWLFMAGSIVKSFTSHNLKIHTKDTLQRFKIGTWVAGSAVLATLTTSTLPQAEWLSYSLAAVALTIFVPFVAIFVPGYVELWQNLSRQQSSGVILLATVATQSIIIMLHAIFGDNLSPAAAVGLAIFDAIFLASGLVLIFIAQRKFTINSLAQKWDNTNCIMHGAVSITGLALVLANCYSDGFLIGVWIVAAGLFFAVETVEIIRATQRIKLYGLRGGLFVYNVSQWSRNFTFGMFYAFSLALNKTLEQSASIGHQSGWQALIGALVSYGQYVVLALLIVEILLTLRSNFSPVKQLQPSASR